MTHRHHGSPDGGPWYRWWLAEDMGFVPLYFERLSNDGTTASIQISMHYEKDEEAEWRLVSWDTVKVYKGFREMPLVQRSELEVAEVNVSIRPEVFRIAFPPRTLIYDDILGTKIDLEGQGLARAGVEGLTSEEQTGRDMDTFVRKVRKETGQAASRATPTVASPSRSWLYLGGALVAIMAALVLLRWVRSRAAGGTLVRE